MKKNILMIMASVGLLFAANPATAQVEEGNVIIYDNVEIESRQR